MFTHDIKYSGQSREDKRKLVTDLLSEHDCDFMVISAPDSLCWLLNIRGHDVPCTPLVNAYAIHASTGETLLFIDAKQVPADVIDEMDEMVVMIDTNSETAATIQTFLSNCADDEERDYCFMLDHSKTPHWFASELKSYGLDSFHANDPIEIMKACKNEVEIEGAHQAHLQDGKALVRFLHWFEQQVSNGAEMTERSAVAQLTEFRSEGELFCEPSFETISGYGANGAVIHYKVSEKTNKTIEEGSLYLVDSGGQYLNGTTDVTRTLPVGTPSADAVKHFTLVLKGHLALAMASFPEGTTGSQLDVLARQFLWNHYLDYDHGTGHGVGSYLSVHEGPQRISKTASNVALKEGMIVSNEPGVYLENKYGIRIENLIMVMKKKNGGRFHKDYYGFVPLTLAPIERRLIDASMLTEQELKGLNAYHDLVLDELTPLLEGNEEVLEWLKEKCAPISSETEVDSVQEPEKKRRRNQPNRNNAKGKYRRRSRNTGSNDKDSSSQGAQQPKSDDVGGGDLQSVNET
ncbi:MAG: aminopeptidase P family protein [Rickettsiales bacterium]|nr:aminopeptidase P family protein [Rickettsiales bacterium]